MSSFSKVAFNLHLSFIKKKVLIWSFFILEGAGFAYSFYGKLTPNLMQIFSNSTKKGIICTTAEKWCQKGAFTKTTNMKFGWSNNLSGSWQKRSLCFLLMRILPSLAPTYTNLKRILVGQPFFQFRFLIREFYHILYQSLLTKSRSFAT